jgi:fumarate hydratase subunit beta
MAEYRIDTNQLREYCSVIKVKDRVVLSGTIYTARDAAHKKLSLLIENGEPLPFELKDAVIYYAGPTPTPKGLAIGSCGPTTSSRMDKFTPKLLDLGLVAMIGKGERDSKVIDAIKRNNAVYLCAIGGAGALASKCVTSCEVVAFDELGCESIKKLTIKDFPLIVGNDAQGNNIYENDNSREN